MVQATIMKNPEQWPTETLELLHMEVFPEYKIPQIGWDDERLYREHLIKAIRSGEPIKGVHEALNLTIHPNVGGIII